VLIQISGYLGSPLSLDFFRDPNNWYSNDISIQLFENIKELCGDLFSIGYFNVKRSARSKNLAVTGLMHVFGAKGMVYRVNEIMALYNKTKVVNIIELTNRTLQAEINYKNGFAHIPLVTEQNLGAYVAGFELLGLQNITYKVLKEDFSANNGYTLFEFNWQPLSWHHKLRWLIGFSLSNLLAKTYLSSHHVIEHYHSDLINGLKEEVNKQEQALKNKNNTPNY